MQTPELPQRKQRLGASYTARSRSLVVWNPRRLPLSEPGGALSWARRPGTRGLTDRRPDGRAGALPTHRQPAVSHTRAHQPACGYRRLIPSGTRARSGSSEPAPGAGERPCASASTRDEFVIDYDKRSGRERLDQASGTGFGEFLYHRYDAVAFGMEKAGTGFRIVAVLLVLERPVGCGSASGAGGARAWFVHGVIRGPQRRDSGDARGDSLRARPRIDLQFPRR